jgi:hypothetical protein
MAARGGRRPGAGRKQGSKNRATVAKEAVAEVLGVTDADLLDQAILQRGHALLLELERIAMDPTQPATLRIMAARTALPFLLPRPQAAPSDGPDAGGLINALEEGRRRLARFREAGLYPHPDA